MPAVSWAAKERVETETCCSKCDFFSLHRVPLAPQGLGGRKARLVVRYEQRFQHESWDSSVVYWRMCFSCRETAALLARWDSQDRQELQ